MTTILEFVVLFAAILLGIRFGGIALGFWGGVGLFVLSVVFGVMPTSPPVDVMLIILAVCMCASCMEAVGGLDILVRIAAKIIRKNPKYVAVVAPVVSFFLTFFAGTGNAVYAILPVVYEVSYNANVRPERAMAATAVAGQVGITSSPIAAAVAAMIGLMAQNGHTEIGLGTILMVTFPACLIGVVVGAVLGMFRGKDLKDDAAYQARLARGEVLPPQKMDERELPAAAKWSVLIFFGAIAIIVVAGFFPELRVLRGQTKAVSMSLVIECVMLAAGALMCLVCKPDVGKIAKSQVLNAGVVSIAAVFGIAWMSDSFIAANSKVFMEVAGELAQSVPVLFAVILAVMSALLTSQGATTRAVMPLGFALGINPMLLVAMFPAVNCLFILPITGPALAAVGMDRSGTTYIGKYVLNHSFQFPGIVMVVVAVAVGYAMVLSGIV
jgi:anaerobic C4-dicarboxylate transporter-like protein